MWCNPPGSREAGYETRRKPQLETHKAAALVSARVLTTEEPPGHEECELSHTWPPSLVQRSQEAMCASLIVRSSTRGEMRMPVTRCLALGECRSLQIRCAC